MEVGVRCALRNLKNIQESSIRAAVGEIRRPWVCEGLAGARSMDPQTGAGPVNPASSNTQRGPERRREKGGRQLEEAPQDQEQIDQG